MRKILIPIDGSGCALRAVELVVARRQRYSRPDDLAIHLVNIQPLLPHDITRFASHQQVADFHLSESDRQTTTARQALDQAGVPYTYHHGVGDIAEEITALAERLGCDQIVMGSHGHSALAELLLGSITAKVIHLAKIPILIVK